MPKRNLTQAEIDKILFETDTDDEVDDDFGDPDFELTKRADSSPDSSDLEGTAEEVEVTAVQLDDGSNSDDSNDTEDESQDNQHCLTPAPNSHVIWSKVRPSFAPRFSVPKEVPPVVLLNINRSATQFEVFEKLFPSSLLDQIAQCTNQRLEMLERQLKKPIRKTDPGEIMMVLGCSLVMCYNRLPNLSDYWSQHISMGNTSIKNTISRDRYQLVSSKMYYCNPEKPPDSSKTYYIDEVISCLKQTFHDARGESTFQSIDESMTKFKGRSSLKQYMPQKPVKRGIKMWQRCDSMTGYTYDMNVYSGKETENVEGTLGERVVKRLVATIRGKDTAIAIDRFFTSVLMMETLDFPVIGTVIKTRKDVPKFNTKLEKRGDAEFLSTAHGTLCTRWMDSKEVLVLSNCHNTTLVKTQRRMKDGSKKDFDCPQVIEFYNKIMGGVDLSDQKVAVYDWDRKSTKWWRKVFYRLLMVSVVNAWILFQEIQHKKMQLLQFIIPLAEHMMATGKTTTSVIRKPCCGRPSKIAKNFIHVGDHLPVVGKSRRRCIRCSQMKVEKRTTISCPMCNVGLCKDCFTPYHTS